ncbi:guanylate kinase [Paludibaculum fermentans]|uniref:Guanylate kinase n=1 Tax=Paludibaculum fermentans TaxID=1473598 RepID=A0A7S7NTT8_PALFE|nr:guanylate kinase [Paludibaculum fermentans]QOY89702.1 guanylate kinase [Paludibaculum fermentans]
MSQVIIISAPSGSGKSTLVRNLLERDPNLIFSVSYTTRAPRGQEAHGREYNFVSREDFQSMIERGEFIEWAQVFDDFYGTHRCYVEQGRREGKDVVLDIDVKGARQLREKIPEAISVFILAPSREELEKRLRARGDVSEEVIQKRVAEAAREIQDFGRYDYVLVNDDVEVASSLLCCIVMTARVQRKNAGMQSRVEQILATFEKE